MAITNITLTNNIIGLFVVKVFSMLASLALIPLLNNYFESDLNLIGGWLAFASLIAVISSIDLGIGNRLKNDILNRLSQKKGYLDLIIESFCAQLIVAILLSVIFTVWALYYKSTLGSDYNLLKENPELIYISLAYILLAMPLKLSFFILQARQANALSSLVVFIPQLLIVFALIFFGTYSYTYPLLQLATIHLLATVMVYFGAFFLSRDAFRASQIENIKLILTKTLLSGNVNRFFRGFPFFVIQMSIIFLYSNNEIFYLVYGQIQDVVYYQYYFRPFSFFSVGLSLVSLPFWSAIRLSHLNHEALRTRQLCSYVLSLNIPIFFLIILLCYFFQSILDLWLGSGFYLADSFNLLLFSMLSILVCLMHSLSSILSGFDLISFQAKTLVFGFLVKLFVFGCLQLSDLDVDYVVVSTVVGLLLIVTILSCKTAAILKSYS
tara:strand:- start:102 stop:1415 length:1314 start_codon:yes stop_codon:yes gene_type:complete